MTLLSFAAELCAVVFRAAAAPLLLGARRLLHGAPAAAIDRYRLHAGRPAANSPHAAAAVDRWDRQTDGRAPYLAAYYANSVYNERGQEWKEREVCMLSHAD